MAMNWVQLWVYDLEGMEQQDLEVVPGTLHSALFHVPIFML